MARALYHWDFSKALWSETYDDFWIFGDFRVDERSEREEIVYSFDNCLIDSEGLYSANFALGYFKYLNLLDSSGEHSCKYKVRASMSSPINAQDAQNTKKQDKIKRRN